MSTVKLQKGVANICYQGSDSEHPDAPAAPAPAPADAAAAAAPPAVATQIKQAP